MSQNVYIYTVLKEQRQIPLLIYLLTKKVFSFLHTKGILSWFLFRLPGSKKTLYVRVLMFKLPLVLSSCPSSLWFTFHYIKSRQVFNCSFTSTIKLFLSTEDLSGTPWWHYISTVSYPIFLSLIDGLLEQKKKSF